MFTLRCQRRQVLVGANMRPPRHIYVSTVKNNLFEVTFSSVCLFNTCSASTVRQPSVPVHWQQATVTEHRVRRKLRHHGKTVCITRFVQKFCRGKKKKERMLLFIQVSLNLHTGAFSHIQVFSDSGPDHCGQPLPQDMEKFHFTFSYFTVTSPGWV